MISNFYLIGMFVVAVMLCGISYQTYKEKTPLYRKDVLQYIVFIFLSWGTILSLIIVGIVEWIKANKTFWKLKWLAWWNKDIFNTKTKTKKS